MDGGDDSAASRHERARMSVRLRPATGTATGRDEALGLASDRDGLLYVPDTAEVGAPLLVFLHGAGGTGRRELRCVLAAADRYGVVVAAPDSRGPTWDLILGGFGPDVAFLDRVVDSVLDRCDVDHERLALGGVSDGASYALSVGLSNGDTFGSVIAFSPGFAFPGEPTGTPAVFVSHGTRDPILPIDTCSRMLVPSLQRAGYTVTYEEFDGGHTVPPPVSDHAIAWWLGAGGGEADPPPD